MNTIWARTATKLELSTTITVRSKLGSKMPLLLVKKLLRLSLAISVSLWMAGAGCLLGCSNQAHAAASAPIESANTVVAENSCTSASHDCCAKMKAHQESTAATNPQTDLTASQVRPTQSSMTETCPMAVNASAIVSKARAEISKASLAKTVQAPLPSISVASHSRDREQPSFYNRGPTYLRCCVFLI
jgi:hypothetical protein